MQDLLYPMQLSRILSPRLWGGGRLLPFLGLPDPGGAEPVGESWQVFGGNEVQNGRWAGRTLAEVAEVLEADLLGEESISSYGSRVPLLAKFVDAGSQLSIQVHPDDAFAAGREAASGHLGKEEAWLVLEAVPGARIVWGFDRKVGPDEVRKAVRCGTLEGLVREFEVAPGDVILNPPGTVHAVGAGIFLFEIQQSSDLTYRLYDFGRRDACGRLRALHLDRALEVATLEPAGRPKVEARPRPDGWTELVQTPRLVLLMRRVVGTVEVATRPESLELLTVTSGELRLEAGPHKLAIVRGGSAVLPARLGPYRLSGAGTVLRAGVVL